MDIEPVADGDETVVGDTTSPEPLALPPLPPPATTKRTWAIAALAAIVALGAGVFGVKALDKKDETTLDPNAASQTQTFGNRATAGKITSIDGTSFKVAANDGNGGTSTVDVTTSKSTTYSESVTGALTDLKKGDNIVATGTTADGVFTATKVSEAPVRLSRTNSDGGATKGGPPPGGATDGGPRFYRSGPDTEGGAGPQNAVGPQGGANFGSGNFSAGEITNIQDGVLTLSSPDGSTVTVKTTADTTFVVTKTIAFKDLKVGDSVRVGGTNTNGTVAADDITKGDLDGGGLFFGGGPQT